MSREKFLVIGSNSFSGASFVAHVLQEGAEVVGISRSPEPSDVFLPYRWSPHPGFSFFQFDLNKDLDAILGVVREFQPDYVVTFAAQGMVAQSWENPGQWLMTNTVSMINLHDRLRKCDFLKKYVHISTPEVYGHTQSAIRENTDYHPSTPYAVSKAACDMSLMAFVKAYGFPAVLTRAANVCGPGQLLYRIIPKTIFCIMKGEKLKLQGGGRSERSFIHIQDVAEGTLRAARFGKPGDIFHFSTDRRITIRALVEELCRQMKVSFADTVDIVEGRLGQDAAYRLDWEKAKKELGWEPAKSLEQVLAEIVDWMKKNWQVLKDQPSSYIHKP